MQILKVHLKKEVLRSEIFLVRPVCGIYPKGNSGGRYHAGAYISCERLWPNVKKPGFIAIGTYEMPREGDVIIIQPYAGGNPSGHMAIYDGAEWYSDFKQRDMWAGPGYRAARPSYTIYRKN